MSDCRACQGAAPALGDRVRHVRQQYREARREGTGAIRQPAEPRNGHRFAWVDWDNGRPTTEPYALCDLAVVEPR